MDESALGWRYLPFVPGLGGKPVCCVKMRPFTGAFSVLPTAGNALPPDVEFFLRAL